MSEGVVIRPVETIDEMHACEDVQRRAWNFAGDLDIVPLTQLVAARKAGGVVLGGFDRDGALRGFCYGFVGRDADGSLFHYSHMTAVDEGMRSSGLGGRLKWAQRQQVLEQGIERMVWTYDPLESVNGYFNFSKLGVVAGHYWQNLYGETSSPLHRGTPTDRLRADWYLRSGRVVARSRGERGELCGRITASPDSIPSALKGAPGSPGPAQPDLGAQDPLLSCEIPTSLQETKRADAGAAYAWRMATRSVFEHYLQAGYYVRECVRTNADPVRTLYVLERGDLGALLDPAAPPRQRG